MKKRVLALYILIVTLLTSSYLVFELAEQGRVRAPFLYATLYPFLQRVNAPATDLKFRFRGPKEAKSPVVIVEIDDPSLERIGRWPWDREQIAYLAYHLLKKGAKVVAFDVLFPEEQVTIPEGIREEIVKHGLGHLVHEADGDAKLVEVLRRAQKSMVLEWTAPAPCRPKFSLPGECFLKSPDQAFLPTRFALPMKGEAPKEWGHSVLMTSHSAITLYPTLFAVTRNLGFANDFRDEDGVVRRAGIVMLHNGNLYPSFSLAVARVARGEEPQMTIDPSGSITHAEWSATHQQIPISRSGMINVDLLGPEGVFPKISAAELFSEANDEAEGRQLASNRLDILKNAIVIVGATAQALGDIHPTVFDSRTPGVEIQATIVDNLMTGGMLKPVGNLFLCVAIFMVLGVSGYIVFARKLEARPAFLLFGVVLFGIAVVDYTLFTKNYNLATAFLYLEIGFATFALLAEKYFKEEHDRKFLKAAFGKYVSPDVVSSIIKDPKSLSLGGKKEVLTILFCDIRSFTTFSERVDAKTLSTFLNEYHSLMTDIIFQHGGTLDKYIGDAIMAFWGAPVGSEAHAKQATEAASEMIRKTHEHKERFKATYGIDLKIGIGLNTDSVSVGNMGSRRSFNYTAIGDGVNLASRLEAATKAYGVEILSTQVTVDNALKHGAKISYRSLGSIKVKGKNKSVPITEILAESHDAKEFEPFLAALALYQNRKFVEAKAAFQKLSDPTSQRYVEACDELIASPPPADWDGCLEMHEK